MSYPAYINTSPNDLNLSSDVDLRKEVHELIYGTEKDRARGVIVVLQSVIMENGRPKKSPYSYALTGEGTNSERGPNTTRDGNLCSESLIRVLYAPISVYGIDEKTSAMGNLSITRDICYLSHKDVVKESDIIVFIQLDEEGQIVNPVRAANEFKVVKVYPRYSDNGRLEYHVAIFEDQK